MTYNDFIKRYTYDPRTDKLAEASFWTLYKAKDTILNRNVSIKVAKLKEKKAEQLSLTDEFSLLKKLPPHPNIANYEDVFSYEHDNEQFEYGILDYYPEGTLSNLNNSNISIEGRELIAKDILRAISFLESQNLVHCNINPSNILMQRNDSFGQVRYIPKLSDFSFAKNATTDDNNFSGAITRYSSPDLFLDKKSSFKIDLWSWAVLSFELLTRRTLFGLFMGNNVTEAYLHKAIELESISLKLRALPTAWQNALAACLSKESEQRADSAETIFSLLQGIATDASTNISPPPVDKKTKVETISSILQGIATDASTRISPPPVDKNTKAETISSILQGIATHASTRISPPPVNKKIKEAFSSTPPQAPKATAQANSETPPAPPKKEQKNKKEGDTEAGKIPIKWIILTVLFIFVFLGAQITRKIIKNKSSETVVTQKQTSKDSKVDEYKTRESINKENREEEEEETNRTIETAEEIRRGETDENQQKENLRKKLQQLDDKLKQEEKEKTKAEQQKESGIKESSTAPKETKKIAPTKKEVLASIKWVKIPAGSFMMGGDKKHKVSLSPYEISAYEITFEQYDAFCELTKREKPADEKDWGRGKRPVINVSWDDAKAFAEWLGCRLPTEAEWENACRAGTTTPHHTGDTIIGSQANIEDIHMRRENRKRYFRAKTLPVGSFASNAWGIYDMHGNVAEWCNDFYDHKYYNESPENNPQGPSTGYQRVIRGGGWNHRLFACASHHRSSCGATEKRSDVGIRLAR